MRRPALASHGRVVHVVGAGFKPAGVGTAGGVASGADIAAAGNAVTGAGRAGFKPAPTRPAPVPRSCIRLGAPPATSVVEDDQAPAELAPVEGGVGLVDLFERVAARHQ